MTMIAGALVCVVLAPYVMLAVVARCFRQLCGRVGTLERRWNDTRRMHESNAAEDRPPKVVRNGPPAWVTDPEKWRRDEAGRRAVAESVAREVMDEHRRHLEAAARKAFMRRPDEDEAEEGSKKTAVGEEVAPPQAQTATGQSDSPNLLR